MIKDQYITPVRDLKYLPPSDTCRMCPRTLKTSSFGPYSQLHVEDDKEWLHSLIEFVIKAAVAIAAFLFFT